MKVFFIKEKLQMSRIFENIYKKVALISPWLEVALRRIYWNNIEIFKKLNPSQSRRKTKESC